MQKIRVKGAREHNLKDIEVEIPKNKLVVITGPSGSGKSSLALDTLYAEGRRRYVESLSSYARQFLGVSKKPDVDKIEGLCPAIAIDQKTVGYNPRSTVGTITEIYDYMRVLFARVGTPHCPECQKAISAQSPQVMTKIILNTYDGCEITWGAPIAIDRKGEFTNQISALFEKGYNRFMIDGEMHRFSSQEEINELGLSKSHRHTITLLVDRFTVKKDERVRIQEAIERSFALAKGFCLFTVKGADGLEKEELFSAHRMCVDCAVSFPELEPRLFSFNSPLGACDTCHGLGVLSDWEKSEDEKWQRRQEDCFSCKGSRLCPEARSVTVGGKNIAELSATAINDLREFFEGIELNEEQEIISGPLLKEICSRLTFLCDVGLAYLTIGRTARSLSGGEGQRIRLATQIGSSLSGVLYVLDEPSIGLHQRDNDKLIETLKKLRDQGNTVLVVEHDEDTVRESDYVIDIGPAAGVHGGQIVATGTPEQLKKNKKSLTGKYLSGALKIEVPKERRKPTGEMHVLGAKMNNLKDIDVAIPLGVLIGVSGVSGSGKSSLVMHTLAPRLANYYRKGWQAGGSCEDIQGLDKLRNCVLVNQSPIGRTPRSNPATYLGVFDGIREIFAQTKMSKERGYMPGRFSFNVSNGRCSGCKGEGKNTIEMHFLENVQITCKQCNGLRYNDQTLEVEFNGKNIADVLAMSFEDAAEFFENFSSISKRLKLMCDVGLGYLTLGQPSTTLSGGEAQRVKLVSELAKRGNQTFYILDEPTTGLHSHDIAKLIEVLQRLVELGNTVLVIEHNIDVLKTVDHVIDIGPLGGDMGGYVVAQGTPEEVADSPASYTGYYLKRALS